MSRNILLSLNVPSLSLLISYLGGLKQWYLIMGNTSEFVRSTNTNNTNIIFVQIGTDVNFIVAFHFIVTIQYRGHQTHFHKVKSS